MTIADYKIEYGTSSLTALVAACLERQGWLMPEVLAKQLADLESALKESSAV